MISDWILVLLRQVAAKKLGPTLTARWLFIFTQLIYDGYQVVLKKNNPYEGFPKTFVDEFSISDIPVWMDTVCDYSCQRVISLFGGSYTRPDNLKLYLDHTQWSNWVKRAESFLAIRDSDGWRNSTTLDGTIPNQNIYIDVKENGLPTLNDYNSWTALKVDNKNMNYLTPEWGKVKGVVNDTDFQSLLDNAIRYYPSEDQLEKEIKEVLDISNTLTDKQKMSAEFWAGGPMSVTPPGFWFIISYCICKSYSVSRCKEVQLYTTLGMGVFQASICAWKLKRNYLQARPIQTIRHTQVGEDDWLPYQESNFVTPPFPDFVSGHSTFSATCSSIIYQVLQNNLLSMKGVLIDSELLKLLNPDLFSEVSNEKFNLCQINILKSASNIDPDTPLSGCSIGWNSLDEMAEDAGKSRIYGGIHYESSNQAGLSLGRELALLLCEKNKYLLEWNEGVSVNGFRIYK